MFDAGKEEFDPVELFGEDALFTNLRIDRSTLPDGLYCYDLRGSDYDPGFPITVEKSVVVNHAGCVITTKPVDFKGSDFKALGEGLNFSDKRSCTLKNFCDEHSIPYDIRKDKKDRIKSRDSYAR